MSVAAGERLGPYEVLGLIGAGGMGEVYKARDTRLDRTVAIKILPSEIAADHDRRARFEREAKTIAGLTHPHICTLYDIGEHAGSMFLIMEHLEGETLAHRIEKGPLPIDQALEYGAQIAEALAVAHRAGIVHRDLKPGNVMLTKSGTKLLDFGVAKLTGHGEHSAAARFGSMPTGTAPLTGEGVIVGTLRYMAPEQLQGREADARTDIWALGLVLYEMVTGRHAFEGESGASLMAAILERQPAPPSTFQALTPPAVDRAVRRCLAKSPDARWQDALDLADELRWLSSSDEYATAGKAGNSGMSSARRAVLMSVALLALASVVGGILVWQRTHQVPPPAVERFVIPISAADYQAAGALALSADGRLIAFVARGPTASRVYLRSIDRWDAEPIAGSEGARLPCFSPDGERIVFVDWRQRQPVLKKIALRGGAPQVIADVRVASSQGGTGIFGGIKCLADGSVLFSRDRPAGIWRAPATGGALEPIVQAQQGLEAGRYSWPELLPDGLSLLFTIVFEGRTRIVAFRPGIGNPKTLVEPAMRPLYVPEAGHLLYLSGDQLLAVRFDAERLEIIGDARTIAEGVGAYDVSRTGVLVYSPQPAGRLVWIDRAGASTPLPFRTRRYLSVRLSPDGRRAVLNVQEGTARHLYVAQLKYGEPLTRLTPGDDDLFGMFTPDGARVLFTSGQGGRYNIFSTAADGSAVPQRLTDATWWQKPTSIWPLGPVLLINQIEGGQSDILRVDLGHPNVPPIPVVRTGAPDVEGVFSPDGRWLAYEQTTSGLPQIYVQRYPAGSRAQVSTDGGWQPAWNARGTELFYQSAEGVMSVGIENGLRIGSPARLFEHRRPVGERDWDVSPDGERFIVAESASVQQIYVVKNWIEELKAKVPVGK